MAVPHRVRKNGTMTFNLDGLNWDQRLPFLSTAAKRKMLTRFAACGRPVAGALGIPFEHLKAAEVLGCGHYGCTLRIPTLPRYKNVLKVTGDNLEANIVGLLTGGHLETPPPGIARYTGVWLLGQCSISPWVGRVSRLEYKQYIKDTYGNPGRRTVYYQGPGAPHRPIWVLQREELENVQPALNQWAGKKMGALRQALRVLKLWAARRAEEFGAPGGFGVSDSSTYDEIQRTMSNVHGVALLEAVDWLVRSGVGFYDFEKVANLGWRPGTGLVIRDIGFAATADWVDDAWFDLPVIDGE